MSGSASASWVLSAPLPQRDGQVPEPAAVDQQVNGVYEVADPGGGAVTP
jgi:hypothetical protein